jgi:hypothetical protein
VDVTLTGGAPPPGSATAPGADLVIDQTFGAMRSSVRPLDYQSGGSVLGHYRMGAATGLTTGVAAAGAIFSFRWVANAIPFMVLTRISVNAVITTAFGAAQAIDVDAVIVRGFTASDTGGTAIASFGVSNKMRSTMGNSLVLDARIATTAALAAGTGTADSNAFAIGMCSQTNAIGSGGPANGSDLYAVTSAGQHPIVLGANEGFRVRVVTAQGGTGVVKYYVAAEWSETNGY